MAVATKADYSVRLPRSVALGNIASITRLFQLVRVAATATATLGTQSSDIRIVSSLASANVVHLSATS